MKELTNGNYILKLYQLAGSDTVFICMKEKIFYKRMPGRVKEIRDIWTMTGDRETAKGAMKLFEAIGYFDQPVDTH